MWLFLGSVAWFCFYTQQVILGATEEVFDFWGVSTLCVLEGLEIIVLRIPPFLVPIAIIASMSVGSGFVQQYDFCHSRSDAIHWILSHVVANFLGLLTTVAICIVLADESGREARASEYGIASATGGIAYGMITGCSLVWIKQQNCHAPAKRT